MDENSFYSRALTTVEVASIFQAGTAGKCKPPEPPGPGRTSDLAGDFSLMSNPNGVWSYGAIEGIGGAFKPFRIKGLTPDDHGLPVEYWQLVPLREPTVFHNSNSVTVTAGGGQGVFPPGTVWLYSGTDGAPDGFGVIRFTVPPGRAGNYRVETSVRPVYEGLLQGDTDFHVAKNGAELFGRFLVPTASTGYSNELVLADGDAVDFVVGRGSDRSGVGSGLKIQATIIALRPSDMTNCVPPQSELVAWWPLDGDGSDAAGANSGVVLGGPVFVDGLVGEAMRFDGINDEVNIPGSISLDVSRSAGFTIELWINPANVQSEYPLVEWNNRQGAVSLFFGAGVPTWGGAGSLNASLIDTAHHIVTTGPGLLTTGVWQHVALTYSRATGVAQLYRNGAVVAEQNLGSVEMQTSYDVFLGRRFAISGQQFFYAGDMDEVSLYDRALSSVEIQAIFRGGSAGKCRNLIPTPPQITAQPQDQIVRPGGTATFSVGATGTLPLSYQWFFEGNELSDETASSLTLNNVQLAQAGNYSVRVSNALGSVMSRTALLTVTEPPSAVLLRGPYLQSGTPSEITVRWRTDAPTESRVRFGLNPDSLNGEVVDGSPTAEHAVRLTGLTPDTRYYYAIVSGNTDLARGPGYSFTTAPALAKPTRIWAVGDSGVASVGYIGSVLTRDAYSAYAGARPTDVWLMLGDNAYGIGSDAEYQVAVFDVYRQMLRQTVLWPTIGNHDARFVGEFPYLDIFSLPRNGEAGGVPSGVENYYSFDYGNIHFVCLDSEVSDRSPGGAMLTWLEADLSANSKDWLIAFWHTPPYSKGSHNSDNPFDSGGRLIDMREYVVPILEQYGVDLVLCGHSHSYERSYLIDGHYDYSWTFEAGMMKNSGSGRPDETGPYLKPDRGPAPHQGAVYVVAGSSGWVTPDYGLDHPAMFISLRELGSVVIDIDGQRLDARFLRETGAIDDYFTIIKGTGPGRPAQFRIATFRVRNGTLTAEWESVPGGRYQIQRTWKLERPDWAPFGPEIQATGARSSWSGPAEAGLERCFFRVVQK
jgi:3',5'-cyclic AMP phosphodiesterase CpdA